MKHLGTIKIETERLLLRRVVPEDAEAMYRNWTGDPEVTKYLTWPTHASAEVSREFISYLLGEYKRPTGYAWAIVLKDDRPTGYAWAIVLKDESPEPIGMISAVGMKEEVGSIEVGYCLGRNWWNRGIMTEALGAVIDFFFTEVGANRIEARHDVRNPASGAVMRHCGMHYEGTHLQSDLNNQGICDTAHYGRLAGAACTELLPR